MGVMAMAGLREGQGTGEANARRAKNVSLIGLVLVGLGLLVAGCTASPDLVLQTSEPYSAQWCQAAKAYPRSGRYLYAVGQCHERGVPGFEQNENIVTYYYSEAARWGNVDAGAALAARGLPVPENDLQQAADERASRERQTRAIANAIAGPRPAAPPRNNSVLFPNGGPNMFPGTTTSRPAPPRPATVSRPVSVPSVNVNVNTRSNTSVSEKKNCVNGVCRIERTTCTNGACTTTVQ